MNNGKIATSGVVWLAVSFGLYFNYYYQKGFRMINVISTYVYPEVVHLLQFAFTIYKVSNAISTKSVLMSRLQFIILFYFFV